MECIHLVVLTDTQESWYMATDPVRKMRILCLKRVFESSFWSVEVELVYLIQLLFENLHVKCEDHVLLKVLNKNLL